MQAAAGANNPFHLSLFSKLEHAAPFYPQATFSEHPTPYNDPDLDPRIKSEPSYLNLDQSFPDQSP